MQRFVSNTDNTGQGFHKCDQWQADSIRLPAQSHHKDL